MHRSMSSKDRCLNRLNTNYTFYTSKNSMRRLTKEDVYGRISPEPNTGCWLWIGHFNATEYGQISYQGKMWRAHRLIYLFEMGHLPESSRGPKADTVVLDHICNERSCVNPRHLCITTARDNTLSLHSNTTARKNSLKTACPKGHVYNYTYPDGRRGCSECRIASAKVSYYRNRGAQSLTSTG
jgi:hypothetical protein